MTKGTCKEIFGNAEIVRFVRDIIRIARDNRLKVTISNYISPSSNEVEIKTWAYHVSFEGNTIKLFIDNPILSNMNINCTDNVIDFGGLKYKFNDVSVSVDGHDVSIFIR